MTVAISHRFRITFHEDADSDGDVDSRPLNNLAKPPQDEWVEVSGGMGLPEEERRTWLSGAMRIVA